MENTVTDILMRSDDFKVLFGVVATRFGFKRAFGGWFMESPETTIVLDLQKSNYSDKFYLNIKIYIQGLFGNCYKPEKKLVKTDVGDVFTRAPLKYHDIFNLESAMDESERIKGLHEIFGEYIQPIATLASTRVGIFELDKSGRIYLLPAVREALSNLIS